MLDNYSSYQKLYYELLNIIEDNNEDKDKRDKLLLSTINDFEDYEYNECNQLKYNQLEQQNKKLESQIFEYS